MQKRLLAQATSIDHNQKPRIQKNSTEESQLLSIELTKPVLSCSDFFFQ